MRVTAFQIALIFLAGLLLGYFLKVSMTEGFETVPSTPSKPQCSICGTTAPCSDHPQDRGQCPLCPPYPDMTKYILKSSIPPSPTCPDMAQYMLKTECPPVPDLSQYVLKASVPKPQPIIVDSSACKGQCGECPPCPRPRCPDVKCPAPTVCPKPAACPRQVCPDPVVKCKTETVDTSPVRPFLAPLSMGTFGAY